MRFLLDREQREFARTLDRMLGAAGTPAVVRSWADGEHAPGRELWRRLAGAGVFTLAVPEEHGGAGPRPLAVALAVAFTELGRHAVPGPLVETAVAAVLLARLGEGKDHLPRIASGEAMASLCLPPGGPYALDADASDLVVHGADDRLLLTGAHGPVRPSLDPARRLARPLGGDPLADGGRTAEAIAHAADWAAFLTAAQALGVGLALLDRTVRYARERVQFGVPIGAFQAVKHRLADAMVALEFARPLVYGAAVALEGQAPSAGAEAAAAKAACGEAAYGAARAALQTHGALGYTSEHDLSLWLGKARALRTAWGTPGACRARALSGLA
jgi:alkylation response protein AidB-like acyl-CoA dehydrogenase